MNQTEDFRDTSGSHCRDQESRGNCSELTKKIARIGTSGKHPSNAERDLVAALQLPLATRLQVLAGSHDLEASIQLIETDVASALKGC